MLYELIELVRLVIKGNVHDGIHTAEVVGAKIRVGARETPKAIDTTFTSGPRKGV